MNFKALFSLMLVSTLMAGCLKTRAQLREDEMYDGVPAKVQPVNSYAVDELKVEVTRLTGRIEDLERSMQGDGPGGAHAKSLEDRITALEQAQINILEAIKKLESGLPAPDRVDIFKKGKADHAAGKNSDAVDALTEYLKNNEGKYREEAYFLRGESQFDLKQYKAAILDYSKITEEFPKSEHHPEALYKIGQAFDHLGMKDDAKVFYEGVISKFPKSSQARAAKKKTAPTKSKASRSESKKKPSKRSSKKSNTKK